MRGACPVWEMEVQWWLASMDEKGEQTGCERRG